MIDYDMIYPERNVNQAAKDRIRELAEDLYTYIKKEGKRDEVLSHPFNMGRLLGVEACWMPPHLDKWWSLRCENKRLMILAAFGHLKSNLLWLEIMITLLRRPLDTQILFVRETETMAKHMVQRLQRAITNPVITELFGDLQGDLWTSTQFSLKGLNPNLQGGNMFAVGLGGAVEGFRGQHLRTDDMVGYRKARSPIERDFAAEWFKGQLWPRINWEHPLSSYFGVSSPWHPEDVNGVIMRMPGVRTVVEPGIQIRVTKADGSYSVSAATTDMFPLTEGTPTLESGEGESADYQFLWPELKSVSMMNSLWADMGGTMFSARVQCDVSALQGTLFDPDWLHYTDPDSVPMGLDVVQGWDFAVTAKDVIGTTAAPKSDPDYTCGWTVGYDHDTGDIYLLDMVAQQIADGHVKLMLRLFNRAVERWGAPRQVLVEDNAFQSLIRRAAQRQIPQVMPVKHYSTDKVTRILNLQRWFQTDRVFIREDMPQRSMFEGQYFDFPNGRHDDCMDALEIAMKGLLVGKRMAKIDHIVEDQYEPIAARRVSLRSEFDERYKYSTGKEILVP